MRETIIEQFYFVRRRSAIPLERCFSTGGLPILSGRQRQQLIFIFFKYGPCL